MKLTFQQLGAEPWLFSQPKGLTHFVCFFVDAQG